MSKHIPLPCNPNGDLQEIGLMLFTSPEFGEAFARTLMNAGPALEVIEDRPVAISPTRVAA